MSSLSTAKLRKKNSPEHAVSRAWKSPLQLIEGIAIPGRGFHVWFHVTIDDICCKQTPKVRTSVLIHLLYWDEL